MILWWFACEPAPPVEPGVLTVIKDQRPAWIRNFNPFNSTGGALWPTRNGIYEPLAIYDTATAEWVPWLATSWEYRGDDLVFHLRDGVQWSDGEAFGADDVAATFGRILTTPTLPESGMRRFLGAVEAADPRTVVFHLVKPYSPGFADIAHVPIAAAHAIAAVPDLSTWTNPDPVGTGPFTEVEVFRNQIFRLGRNPRYWQGLPAVTALRLPAVASNEQVMLSLLQGEVDWAGSFVPAIDRVYVARDPEHHHYWFPSLGDTIFLYPNHARPPLDRVEVRKAVSMAIDRALVVDVAMFGYTEPSDATGLSDAYASWRDPEVAAGDWVRHDPDAAGALLDAAGFPRGADGQRGLSFEILVVAGWSDWVRAAQVAADGIRKLGVDVSVRGLDYGAWFERLSRGEFDLSMGWSRTTPTPHAFYEGLMGSSQLRPVGVTAGINWHRASVLEADLLLDAFAGTTDPAEQRALAVDLQRVFAAEAPAIPLFTGPSWGEYNDARFTGFPSAEDPYARLSPNHEPEALLVLARLRPRP